MSRRNRTRNRDQVSEVTRDIHNPERGPCDAGDCFSGGAPTAGIYVNEDNALSLSAMWCGISVICNDIAALPLNVIRQTDAGKVLQPDHPCAELLDIEANEFVSAYQYTVSLLKDAILLGNGYAEIVRDPDTLVPVALYNLPATSVTPEIVRDPENPSAGSRMVYRVQSSEGSSYVLSEDLIHLKSLTDSSGLLGISLVEKAAMSLGLSLACEASASTYFQNGSQAAGFLRLNGTMTPDQKKKFRQEFYSEHGGVLNSNRTGFLTGDWSWVPVGTDPQKSQLIEQRSYSVLEVCRWLNLPPIFLQVYDKASLSYEQSVLDYVTRTLRPWLENYELEMARKLFTREERRQGYSAKHDLSNRLRGDSAAIATFSTAMFQIGAISRNEVRDMFDASKVDGGSAMYLAVNNYSKLDDKGEPVQIQAEIPVLNAARRSLPAPEPMQVHAEASPAALGAIRGALKAELCRLVRREVSGLSGALQDEARISAEFGKLGKVIRESVGPVLTAWNVVTGRAVDLDSFATTWVEADQRALTGSEDRASLMTRWTNSRADELVLELEAM